MIQLNLPSFNYKIQRSESKIMIFDEFRKKFVRLTPEEWVRQHFAHFLVNEKKFPKGLIALEYSFSLEKRKKRADIIAFDAHANPFLVVECKSDTQPINQKVFDQLARYNMAFKVDYLIVTNGMQHYICKVNYSEMNYIFLKEIPDFNDFFDQKLD